AAPGAGEGRAAEAVARRQPGVQRAVRPRPARLHRGRGVPPAHGVHGPGHDPHHPRRCSRALAQAHRPRAESRTTMTHTPAALATDGISIPDPTLIVSWPAAVVAVVLIFGLLMWPGLLAWLNSRRTRAAAEDVRHQVHPNSGKSLRDQTNRM